MAITVRGKDEVRFAHRWRDYCHVLDHGIPSSVGKRTPEPPDYREAVTAILKSKLPSHLAADEQLSRAWARDASSWPRRLAKPFLTGLSPRALNAFKALVELGCQPDMLAVRFHEATRTEDHSKQQRRVRDHLDRLADLRTNALRSLKKYADGRKRFDEYLDANGLGVSIGEAGDGELKMLLLDFEDLVTRHDGDDRRLRRQIDGRREALTGHAEIQLSLHVAAVTGGFQDRLVEYVLDELQERRGQPGRASGALKRRRARWTKQLRGGE